MGKLGIRAFGSPACSVHAAKSSPSTIGRRRSVLPAPANCRPAGPPQRYGSYDGAIKVEIRGAWLRLRGGRPSKEGCDARDQGALLRSGQMGQIAARSFRRRGSSESAESLASATACQEMCGLRTEGQRVHLPWHLAMGGWCRSYWPRGASMGDLLIAAVSVIN